METNDLILALLREIACAVRELLDELVLAIAGLLARALGEPETEWVS